MRNISKYIFVIIILFLLTQTSLLFGALPKDYSDLSDVYAFPIPFIPSRGHTKITFTNLSSEVTIKIYTLSGSLVKTLKETDGNQVHDWYPVENEDGIKVATGLYLYFIYNSEDVKIGKLIINR